MYRHTQKAPLFVLLAGIGLLLFFVARRAANQEPVWVWGLLLGVGVAFLILSISFVHLTVEDERDFLTIRYGPLPLFGKRIAYSQITDVRRARSSLIDGWGIHYLPGRGWIYNLWGFDCVELTLDGRIFRVGTNDADGLEAMLRERCGL